MDPSLVSVCIPTYNGAEFLVECLESVLAQTYPNLEVLVVDDASRDATVAIARGFEARDARVRVVENSRNLGLVGNWNKCVTLARGAWVKFLFQDDLIAPACIERLVGHATDVGCGFAACRRDFIFAEGVDDDTRSLYELHRRLVDEWIPGPVLSSDDLSDLALRYIPRNFVGEPTVALLDARLLARLGDFNPDLIQLCDAEYWMRAGLAGGLAMVRAPLASFRVHAASTTSRNKASRDFRMRVLDPLIVRHEYVFSPHYAALRQRARERGRWSALVGAFWEMAHYARQEAEQHASNGDTDAREEWAALCRRYPRIARVPVAQHMRRKARRVVDLLTGQAEARA